MLVDGFLAAKAVVHEYEGLKRVGDHYPMSIRTFRVLRLSSTAPAGVANLVPSPTSQPTTYVPASPPPGQSVVLDETNATFHPTTLKGQSGPFTAAFTVGGNWQVRWSRTCPQSQRSTVPEWGIDVYTEDGNPAVHATHRQLRQFTAERTRQAQSRFRWRPHGSPYRMWRKRNFSNSTRTQVLVKESSNP
jgi:hypothetical protein